MRGTIFCKKYDLPIKKVIECKDDELPYTGDGTVINSEFLNGSKTNAIIKIIEFLESNNIGNKSVNYKIRDWGFKTKILGLPYSCYLL